MTIDGLFAVRPVVSYSTVAVILLMHGTIVPLRLRFRSDVLLFFGRFRQARGSFNILGFSLAVTAFLQASQRLPTGRFVILRV